MRRLARRLFTLCSAASLLLGVAVCVLWVRSLSVEDTFAAGCCASFVEMQSADGELAFSFDMDASDAVMSRRCGQRGVVLRAEPGGGYRYRSAENCLHSAA